MFDNESPPGAWDREIRARGLWCCDACGWVGRYPSLTDASKLVCGTTIEADRVDRTHLALCPTCFAVVRRQATPARNLAGEGENR